MIIGSPVTKLSNPSIVITGNTYQGILTHANTADRTYTFPNNTGTVALLTDIHAPVTLGTANGLSLSGQTLSLGLASSGVTGALSGTDWNTFNNKQAAYTNLTTFGSLANAVGYLYNDGSGVLSYSTTTAAGVSSFNTRTGAVTLTSSDVTTALNYTPINKAGDTGIGNLSMNALTTSGILTTNGGMNMGRSNSASTGILYYSTTYTAWQTYMTTPGVASGVSGTIVAPTGIYVTDWGLRTFIENKSGFGWTWESGTQTSTTPSIVAELSSVTGNFRTIGSISGTSFNSITGLASATPLMDGIATVGTSTLTARQDHVHPVDTSRQAQLNGNGFVKVSGTTVSYDNSTYLTGTKVDSFNTRTGEVTLTFSDVTTALNYTPINKAGDYNIGNLGISSLIADGILFNAFKGANSDGYNVWIGGGGQSSVGASGTTYMGSRNSALGYQALYSNTTGSRNSAIGYQALYYNTTGYYNSAIGESALYSNTTGDSNSAIGYQALNYSTTGSNNSAIGCQALYSNTTGYYNSAIGCQALYSNTTGYYNSAIGADALSVNTTGRQNSAIGGGALFHNTTGSFNSAIGVSALYSNTTSYYNSAIGYQALYSNTTGYYNSAIGVNALYSNITSDSNSAIGYQALYSNTTGYYNSAIGANALYDLSPTAKAISAFADYSGHVSGTVKATSTSHGRSTGDSLIISGTANYNGTKTITVVDADNFYFTATWVANETTGWWTLSNYVASNNTALGYNTGLGITTGSGNTIIGANVTGLSANLTNNIILANGTGAIKAQHDGTNWTLTGGVSMGALAATTGTFSSAVTGTSFNSITGLASAAPLANGTAAVGTSTLAARQDHVHPVTTPSISINAQSGTTYTLALSDAFNVVTFNSSSAATVTIPTNATVAFPIGTTIDFVRLGTGSVTFAGSSGVTINSKNGFRAISDQYVGATLLKVGTDTWFLGGSLA